MAAKLPDIIISCTITDYASLGQLAATLFHSLKTALNRGELPVYLPPETLMQKITRVDNQAGAGAVKTLRTKTGRQDYKGTPVFLIRHADTYTKRHLCGKAGAFQTTGAPA